LPARCEKSARCDQAAGLNAFELEGLGSCGKCRQFQPDPPLCACLELHRFVFQLQTLNRNTGRGVTQGVEFDDSGVQREAIQSVWGAVYLLVPSFVAQTAGAGWPSVPTTALRASSRWMRLSMGDCPVSALGMLTTR